MAAELLIYALIAAGLIFWLRSILGTRSDDDTGAHTSRLELSEDGKIVGLNAGEAERGEDKRGLIEELAESQKANMGIDGEDAKAGLHTVVDADRDFDVYMFLNAAQDAFVFAVESFADGDRETLEDLLSPDVFAAFDGAISEREKAGETMQTEIQSIQKSEIIEAHMEGKKAFITVRFWADEVTVTKDEDGNIVYGHPDKVTQMRDVWTFCRDVKSRDPRWLVVETREDGAGDNETIPNTH
ncbi:MAG: Tim44/TimA family putative adaptor protein [Alcanivorax sp.]